MTALRRTREARHLLMAVAVAIGTERDKRMSGRCDEARLQRLYRVRDRVRARYLRRVAVSLPPRRLTQMVLPMAAD